MALTPLNEPYLQSPEWTKDLIIYEIATRSFTSPDGPGTGTFRSMAEKLHYMQALGINAIWLTGHSLSDSRHFYNIWTQYACIDPGLIDPSLGREADFKAFIDSAHQHGIRVFLDVIIHGVMDDSSLVRQHPDWFKGHSWGMTDFDFAAHNPELDQWWVNVWTRLCVEFGIDGYRLDLGMRRPDLWRQIRKAAADAGRPIVVINENSYAHARYQASLSGIAEFPPREAFLDVVDFVQRGRVSVLDPHHKIRDEINCDYGAARKWGVEQWEHWLDYTVGDRTDSEGVWKWTSVQLSCHDDGWEDFDGDNPYNSQGSRFVFGYGALYSGMIPIFMAGEEFDAAYRPLPELSPRLFGGTDPGQGTWLYGGVVPWEQLDQPEHQIVLDDIKKLIALRRQEADVLSATPNGGTRRIRRVSFESTSAVPSPYIRWGAGTAILVAGNPSVDADAHLVCKIPLAELGVDGHEMYTITNLWTDEVTTASASDLEHLEVTVRPDKTSGGGLTLLKIEPQ